MKQKKGNRAQNKKSSIEEFFLEEIAENDRLEKKLREARNEWFWSYAIECYDEGIFPQEPEPTMEDVIASELAWK